MKRVHSLLTVLLACAAGCSESSSEPDTAKPPSPLQVELERRVEDAVLEGFSGAILVSHDGERILAGGHGLADREDGTPNAEDTAFDVGSIMKTLTAISIYALEQDGRLALTDTLDALLPDVPADKAAITLLEVVQHRAGFDEYHDTMGDFEPMTRLEARAHIFDQELLFEPGSDEAYSNSGYTLLADVIEEVSGEAFTDFVRASVLVPAGMDHSGFYAEELWQSVDTAIGYEASTFGDNDPATWPYTWSLVGNGGIVTTVIDLERLSVALWAGELLGPDAQAALESDYFASGGAMLGDELVYAQAGAGDYGLGGVAIDAPASGTRVIIATNTYEVFDIESFAVDLATLVLESE